MQALLSRFSRCPSFPRSPTPLTSSVLSPGARYKPQLAHSLAATPRRFERQLARSYRRCSPFCALSSRGARGLGLDPTLGSFRLLSILLRRRRLRHCRFHCSVRALPSDSPLATPPCALAWGPPLSGNRRLDGHTDQDLTVASRHLAHRWTLPPRGCGPDRFYRSRLRRPPLLAHAAPDASSRWCSSFDSASLCSRLEPLRLRRSPRVWLDPATLFRFARAPPESAPRFLLERSVARAVFRSSTL